jgi:hypothetical protein
MNNILEVVVASRVVAKTPSEAEMVLIDPVTVVPAIKLLMV